MHFYGLIKSDANVEDCTVPLVFYDDNGERHVIGKTDASVNHGVINISGEVTDRFYINKLFGNEKYYSFHTPTLKEPIMEFTRFVRKPFMVTAMQITTENIHDIAGLGIGEVKEKDGVPYIALDRRVIPNIRKAYLGWWITKLDDNVRCYSPKVFDNEFVPYAEEWAGWFEIDDSSEGVLVSFEPATLLTSEAEETPEVGAFGRVLQTNNVLVADGFDVVR